MSDRRRCETTTDLEMLDLLAERLERAPLSLWGAGDISLVHRALDLGLVDERGYATATFDLVAGDAD
jgi:hypothetical protein